MKAYLLLAVFLTSTLLYAQEETSSPSSSDKKVSSDIDPNKFKAGLYGMYAINFLKSNSSLFNRKSAGSNVGFGALFESRFNSNLGLNFGFEMNWEFYTVVYNDSVYYNYQDREILQNDQELPNNYDVFLLNERKFKPLYITLPISFKMQSNAIGYWKFYGKFGMQMDVLLTYKTNDVGYINLAGEQTELQDMISKKELQPVRGSANVSAGFHWYFAGSTALFGELRYDYGFSNVFRESKTIYDNYNDYIKLNGNMSLLTLKVGILF